MASILLIEDDELFSTVAAELLRSAGHQVTEARNGVEGLKAYGKGKFDVVVTDLIMPEKEGIETMGELRRINPAVKIIAISGGGGKTEAADILRLARMLGANITLEKPFQRPALLDAIQKLTGAGG